MKKESKTPNKVGRPRKEKKTIEQKAETMLQVHGKDEAVASKIQVSKKKTLDEIWGKKFSHYETNSAEEYNERLNNMTKLDLQKECIKIGLMPNDRRDIMIDRLTKECAKYIAAAQTSSLQPKVIKVSEASRKILAKGNNSLI